MIELKDFVRSTLVELVEGTAEAQKAVRSRGAVINPTSFQAGGAIQNEIREAMGDRLVRFVDFDLAITATKDADTRAKIGVFGGWVGGGVEGGSAHASSSVGRLKFSIPLLLPTGDPGSSRKSRKSQ
jgi:hypothetical protein